MIVCDYRACAKKILCWYAVGLYMCTKSEIMITQYQVRSLLVKEIPQLTEKMFPTRPSLQVYASMNYFTDYTKHVVKDHNFAQVKKCFTLAENLYLNGDNVVRFLIRNCFIYALFPLESLTPKDKLRVRVIIPDTLFAIYQKQVKLVHNQ